MGRALILALLALALLVLGLVGCNAQRTLWQLGLGSFTTDLEVAGVVPRASWLDARLEGHGLEIRTFVPDDAICRHVLEPGIAIDYVERGIGGRFVRDDEACDAVGIGSPIINRARRGRATSGRGTPIPREQATFQILFEDEEVILARGRFPLASTIGWTGGSDSVAVFPNNETCRIPLQRGVASMEYRGSGRTTLSLVSSNGLCPFLGLIQPPGTPAPAR
ncbi:MAG: hypothetical protein ABFS46_07745 [Myxococcota bacterium]